MSNSADQTDPLIEQLSRALADQGPDSKLVDATKSFPSLHVQGEIVGTEAYDTADGVHLSGVRYRPSDERDLLYTFGDADEADELSIRLADGALLARLPGRWNVQQVYVQSTVSRNEADVDEDNYVLCFGPFKSPLRLVVICEGATYCTPWTIV